MSKGLDHESEESPRPVSAGSGGSAASGWAVALTGGAETEWQHLIDFLFNAREEPAAVIDEAGKFRAVNRAWEVMEQAGGRLPEIEPEQLATGELKELLLGKRQEYRREAVQMEAGGCRRIYTLHATALEGFSRRCALITLHDETTRLKLESESRESHNLFRQVMGNVSNGVFLYDLEARFVMVNPVFAEALGLDRQEVIGRSIFEVYKPEMAQTVQEQNLLVLTTGQTLSFELMLETTRGLRSLHVSKCTYRNHRNEVVGVLGIARDVTDRRQVTEALENSERHFRALIENGGDRVALLDENGTIIYASPSTKRLLGYEIEEMIGTDGFLWVHPQDRPSARKRFGEIKDHEDHVVSAQYRVLHKGGEWKWMEATATNRLNDPVIHAVVLNERDITERKRAEAEMVGFSQIIKSSSDAIVSTNLDGHIISWNPAAGRIFGYNEQEAVGREITLLIAPGGRRQHAQLRQAALRGDGVTEYEIQMIHKSGRRVSVALSISPLRNESRVITGYAKIIRDITERRRLEREILEISDREKQRLGQDLHDDLCQHLVGISLISNILADQLEKKALSQAAEARNIADLARHAVDHARSLARGLSPLRLEEDGLVAQMALLVSVTERLFRVPCSFESDLELQVRNLAAATHFYRIMQESLHNAVKHSQASQVTVTLTQEGNQIVLIVADNGVGIGNAVTERAEPGDGLGGLGMHTMQYRARALGAALEFRNPPEGGTTVCCTVPRRKLGC